MISIFMQIIDNRIKKISDYENMPQGYSLHVKCDKSDDKYQLRPIYRHILVIQL